MEEGLTIEDVAPLIGQQALHIRTLEKQLLNALKRIEELEAENVKLNGKRKESVPA